MIIKTAPAYVSPRPATRPITVSEVVPLGAAGRAAAPGGLGTSAAPAAPALSASPAGGPLYVPLEVHQWLRQQAAAKPVPEPERVTLSLLIDGAKVGAAAASPFATATTIPNFMTADEIAAWLTKLNISPEVAPGIAVRVVDFLKSRGGKTVLLGMAGGAFTLGVVQAVAPKWSHRRQFGVALLGAALLVLAFLVLTYTGVMR